MNNSVVIQLEFDDDEASVDDIKDFFAPYASVHVNKGKPKEVKSWDKAIGIALT